MRLRVPAPFVWAPGGGRTLFRALLRYAREQGTNLRFAVPAMTAKCPDRRQLSGLRPAGDRLRVNPEHGCHLGRRKQWLGLWGTCRHFDGLSSWTQFRSCVCCVSWLHSEPGPVFRNLPWMSNMVYCYHIAITSGDNATTRSRSF